MEEAQRQLEEAQKKLTEDLEKPAVPDKPFDREKVELPDISNLAAEKTKSAVVGTFSGAALAGMGGNSIEEKMEGHLGNIRQGIDRLVRLNEQTRRRRGAGVSINTTFSVHPFSELNQCLISN